MVVVFLGYCFYLCVLYMYVLYYLLGDKDM